MCFLGEGYRHENTRAQIRNPAPRGSALGPIGNRIEPHLERIGIRTQGSRRRTRRDIFHLRRIATDLHAGRTPGALNKNEFPPAPLSNTPTPGRSPSDPGAFPFAEDLKWGDSRVQNLFRKPLTDGVHAERLSAERGRVSNVTS